MGLSPIWQQDFFSIIKTQQPSTELLIDERYSLINIDNHLYINLVNLDNSFTGIELVELQEKFKQQKQHVIHLWEDIWAAKRIQVINRLQSFLGQNVRIHGRKTKVVSLGDADAKSFFEENHLQGFVSAKHTFGLFFDQAVVAAASFSRTRPMKLKGADYHSAELVRFASKGNYNISGGLSKLIKHFVKEIKVNDLMTYADRDWSLGNGYDRLGFSLTSYTPSADLYLHKESLVRYFPHRLPKTLISGFESQKILSFEDYLTNNGFVKIFNTGNLKYHLYF